MVNFWQIVDSVIAEADIILMVIDARLINETRNEELLRKVTASKKTLITVINKCDLVDKSQLEKYKQKLHPCVFVSAQKFFGFTKLRHTILRYAEVDPVVVGVVGYPNTGKSSVINALKGRASAGVSPTSGFTKGRQNIRVDNKIRIIDTPGVLAESDTKNSAKSVITASTTKTKDPEMVVYELLREYKKQILRHYGIFTLEVDEEALLEEIAIRLNRRKTGGAPDTETAARMVLQDWQKGRIKI